MFHFLGEILVAVTGEIRNRLLVFGFVVAVVNIQQFQYSVFPFVPVLFGEFLAHQEYQIAYTYFLSRFYFQLTVAGVKIHIGIEIRCGNFRPLLDFLRETVHRYGAKYEPAELLLRITGSSEVDPECFLAGLREKYLA